MKRSVFGALFFVLAVGPAFAQSVAAQPAPRQVELALTLPNGAHPVLRVHEGETASIDLQNGGKFGFVPTVKAGTSDTVLVHVLDLAQSPAGDLGTVETSIRGRAVRAVADPAISVHVTDIEVK